MSNENKPWKRPAPEVGVEQPSDFSAAEIADILAEDDLRKRSQALNEAQERWEDLAFISTEKIPCRECGNRGTIPAGAFGDIECPACRGQRVVEHPGNEKFDMPDFTAMRAAITAYGDALQDRLLPSGHRNKRGLALPPASSVPTMDTLNGMIDEVKEKAREHKQLAAGVNVQRLLKDAPARRRRSGDDDEDAGGQFTEEDLQNFEDEDREP